MTTESRSIPGDGIGPELAEATLRVLDARASASSGMSVDAGEAVMPSTGPRCRTTSWTPFARTGVALKGPITTPVGEGFRSVNVTLRQALGPLCERPTRAFHEGPRRPATTTWTS